MESSLCLCLSAEKFRRFLPLAPEILDELVELAQIRRRASIATNAENAIKIPAIGIDTKNILHLYSLLRPDDEDHHNENGNGDKNSGNESDYSNVSEKETISEVKRLQDYNEETSMEITRKKHQISELQERIVRSERTYRPTRSEATSN